MALDEPFAVLQEFRAAVRHDLLPPPLPLRLLRLGRGRATKTTELEAFGLMVGMTMLVVWTIRSRPTMP